MSTDTHPLMVRHPDGRVQQAFIGHSAVCVNCEPWPIDFTQSETVCPHGCGIKIVREPSADGA